MEALERHRGHFYNWYDTQSLQPLPPLYISSVDSGNLAGHLLTLRQGLLAIPDDRILGRVCLGNQRRSPSRGRIGKPRRTTPYSCKDAEVRIEFPPTTHVVAAALDRLATSPPEAESRGVDALDAASRARARWWKSKPALRQSGPPR
jgi:hypothetical protein